MANLELHNAYTIDEAVSCFDSSTALFSCDDEFVTLDDAILCMAVVDCAPPRSRFTSPSQFAWKPRRMDYDPTDKWPWLPARVREVWSEDRTVRTHQHHLFVRALDEQRYSYLGSAHLGSYGGGPDSVHADFYLETRIPRDLWLKFGGYPGWLVEVNHCELSIDTLDFNAFDAALYTVRQEASSHLMLTRYEEDSFQVFMNQERAWIMYIRAPGDSGLYVGSQSLEGEDDPSEQFECACGIPLEQARSKTILREVALEAVQEFFLNGRLTSSLQWTEDW